MSVILEFKQEAARRTFRPIDAVERRGEILFFTGIRFERHAEDVVPPRRGDDRTVKAGRRRKA